MKKLKFRDIEYILVNSDPDHEFEGAIATVEEYESFSLNRFHLFENGDIMSFGEVIGNVNEIEWLDEEYNN